MCMRDVLFDFIYREKDVFVVETDVFLSFVDATCFHIHNRHITHYSIHFAVLFSFCSSCGVAPHLMQNWTSAGMQH